MARAKQTNRRSSSTSDPVTRYAQAVRAGQIVAGPLVRLACERHLRDLVEAPKRGLVWRLELALRAIGFFPKVLRLADGQHAGQPFDLSPFQAFIVGSLFGWHTIDGVRRFRTAYVETGKGSGKSPLAAGVGLYMLAADGEAGAEVYAAATSRDQAAILFRDAVRMVETSPALARAIHKSGRNPVTNLAHLKSGSYFRPISSEGKSLDGKRVHAALIDELHEHPSAVVVDKMRAGTKARRQALIFEITNSGFDRTSVCWAHHEYGQRILEGQIEDDSFFAYICGLDESDDWRDPAVWLKANPNLGITIEPKYLEEQVREAVGMPSKQSLVRRLNFCQWVDAENPWIDGEAWRNCEVADLDLAELEGAECYAGLDLSGKNDLTSLQLVFPRDSGQWHSIGYFWAPEQGLRDREERDRVPYVTWSEQKHLQTTPGRSIDYAFVAEQIRQVRTDFDLRAIAFDSYRMDDLVRELDELGLSTTQLEVGAEPKESADVTLVRHRQGFISMSPAVEALETTVLNGTLKVRKNPVMTMCAANAVMSTDAAGNRKFDKRPGKSTGRIDGVVALAMAMRIATLMANTGDSVYQTRGILVL